MAEEEPKEETEETSLPEADSVSITKSFSTGFRLLIIAIALTSVLYTLAATGIGNLIWSGAAGGNLVKQEGKVIGSKMIGQKFTSEKYFQPRPSSKGYDGMDSGSANLAPTNDRIAERAKSILNDLHEEGIEPEEVPVSFVTESGSSLDPHIRPASAYLQVPRVSRITGISEDRLMELINIKTEGKFLGLYGQKRVNLLSLNLKVEKILRSKSNE